MEGASSLWDWAKLGLCPESLLKIVPLMLYLSIVVALTMPLLAIKCLSMFEKQWHFSRLISSIHLGVFWNRRYSFLLLFIQCCLFLFMSGRCCHCCDVVCLGNHLAQTQNGQRFPSDLSASHVREWALNAETNSFAEETLGNVSSAMTLVLSEACKCQPM